MKMGVDEEEATLAGVGFDGGTPSLSSLWRCNRIIPSGALNYLDILV